MPSFPAWGSRAPERARPQGLPPAIPRTQELRGHPVSRRPVNTIVPASRILRLGKCLSTSGSDWRTACRSLWLQEWKEELQRLPESEQQKERRQRIEAALDQGHGACWLQRPEIATLVREALRHFEGERYRLHGWVIMPNHVHVLVTPLGDHSLSGVVHSWKSYTATQANKLLGRSGPFWHADYFDRFMRDEGHFVTTLEYIHGNPVKAGLCADPSAWAWTSYHTWDSRGEGGHLAVVGEGGTPSLPGSASTMVEDDRPLQDGGAGARAYAEAVEVYLAFAVDRFSDDRQ